MALFRERVLKPEHFSDDNGRCQMNKAGRHCFYGFYESRAEPARRLLRRYGYTLAKRHQSVNQANNKGGIDAAFVY